MCRREGGGGGLCSIAGDLNVRSLSPKNIYPQEGIPEVGEILSVGIVVGARGVGTQSRL